MLPPNIRLFAPDLIRAIAICLVVILHATDSLTRVPGATGALNLGLNAATRICVPLFVMLSGWLLCGDLRNAEPTSTFLRRHLGRIGWPLLAWSAFYIGWRIGYYGEIQSPRAWIAAAVSSGVYYHLWFLYLMLGLYAVVPLLRLTLAGSDAVTRALFFALWLTIILMPPLLHRSLGVEWIFARGLPLDYLGYFLFGAWFGSVCLTSTQHRLAVATWATGFAATWVGTAYATALNEPLNHTWHGYLRPNVVLMSGGAFLLLVDLAGRPTAPAALEGPVRWLARGSLGIYLLHPVFLELGSSGRLGTILQSLAGGQAGGRLVFAALVLLACGTIVAGVRLIPGLRSLVS